MRICGFWAARRVDLDVPCSLSFCFVVVVVVLFRRWNLVWLGVGLGLHALGDGDVGAGNWGSIYLLDFLVGKHLDESSSYGVIAGMVGWLGYA